MRQDSFSYGIPLTVTPEQIEAAVAQRGGAAEQPTLTQTVTATPAPSVPANATGIAAQELTGNPDMDRQILAARDAQGVSVDVGAGSLTPEEYQQGIEELGAWRNLPENSAWRDTRRLDISPSDLLQVAATFAIPMAAPALAGSLAGATGIAGLGGTVGTTLTQAALSGGLAAATGGDPLQGALSGALLPNPTQLSAGQNLFNLAQRTADVVDTRDTPSVIEQVFSDADYRAGGVIPEQPFETQAPVVEQQEEGGGGATPAPSPAPAPTPAPAPAPAPEVDPEHPYRYEGDGRFVNVLTGDVINRDASEAVYVIGDFYGLPQNIETNLPAPGPAPEPEPEPEEEVVDINVLPDLVLDTTAPEPIEPQPPVAPAPEPAAPTPTPPTPEPIPSPEPAPTPVQEPVEQPAPEPAAGADESVAVGGEGSGTGEGDGDGDGDGEGDGDGSGTGAGMLAAAAAGAAFEPKWTELFKYTTLTPYQKKAMRPFVNYIAQARGMLS